MRMTLKEWKEGARKGISGYMVWDILGDWEEDREKIKGVAWAFKEMIEHTDQDLFKNGVEYMGQDEGSIKGWEYFKKISDLYKELFDEYENPELLEKK